MNSIPGMSSTFVPILAKCVKNLKIILLSAFLQAVVNRVAALRAVTAATHRKEGSDTVEKKTVSNIYIRQTHPKPDTYCEQFCKFALFWAFFRAKGSQAPEHSKPSPKSPKGTPLQTRQKSCRERRDAPAGTSPYRRIEAAAP